MSLIRGFACACALFATLVSAGETASDRSVTIWSWPLTASAPRPLAQVVYNTDTSSSSVTKYTPPKPPHSSDSQIRIGLYDQKTSSWRGVVTIAESFDQAFTPQVQLLLDEDSGDVYHVGFSSYGVAESDREKRRRERRELKAQESLKKQGKGGKSKKWHAQKKAEPELLVQIVKPDTAPRPHLNKPVVLDAEGKLPDKDEDKTFLQKYWWVIAIFLLLQLLTAGGVEDKK